MKPNVSSSSTFPWRGEEKKLSYTWRCGNGGDLREESWRMVRKWRLAEMEMKMEGKRELREK